MASFCPRGAALELSLHCTQSLGTHSQVWWQGLLHLAVTWTQVPVQHSRSIPGGHLGRGKNGCMEQVFLGRLQPQAGPAGSSLSLPQHSVLLVRAAPSSRVQSVGSPSPRSLSPPTAAFLNLADSRCPLRPGLLGLQSLSGQGDFSRSPGPLGMLGTEKASC